MTKLRNLLLPRGLRQLPKFQEQEISEPLSDFPSQGQAAPGPAPLDEELASTRAEVRHPPDSPVPRAPLYVQSTLCLSVTLDGLLGLLPSQLCKQCRYERGGRIPLQTLLSVLCALEAQVAG